MVSRAEVFCWEFVQMNVYYDNSWSFTVCRVLAEGLSFGEIISSWLQSTLCQLAECIVKIFNNQCLHAFFMVMCSTSCWVMGTKCIREMYSSLGLFSFFHNMGEPWNAVRSGQMISKISNTTLCCTFGFLWLPKCAKWLTFLSFEKTLTILFQENPQKHNLLQVIRKYVDSF